jgi:hypothetical protein
MLLGLLRPAHIAVLGVIITILQGHATASWAQGACDLPAVVAVSGLPIPPMTPKRP